MHPLNATAPVVIKLGGALLEDKAGMDAFWESVKVLQEKVPVVIVHGGGQQATALASRLGHTPRVVQGRRVTSDLDLDIMKWTLRGGLNVDLVAQAVVAGIPAVGLSGVDGKTLRVTRRPPWEVEGETVDFGWVGDVEGVDATVLKLLLSKGILPILAPLGVDDDGFIYNVNADTVARAIAAGIGASTLLLVTASGGVLKEVGDPSSRLLVCKKNVFEEGLKAGWISGGMKVKLQVAFDALEAGIPEVIILAPDDLLRRSYATRVVA